MEEQVKTTIALLFPSPQDLLSPSSFKTTVSTSSSTSSTSFKITVPTAANPLPCCHLQQSFVITIMVLATTLFAAQLTDAGMTTAEAGAGNILRELEDPE